MKMKKWVFALLIVSAVLTLGICAVMNLKLIPAIEADAAGLRVPDMRFGYSKDALAAFFAALGETGRDVYLHRQLPLDFFYPVAYAAFFATAFLTLGGEALRKKWPFVAVPVLLAVFDYGENLCTLRFLKAGVTELASFASLCTQSKTLLMYVCFILLIVLFVLFLLRRKKREKA